MKTLSQIFFCFIINNRGNQVKYSIFSLKKQLCLEYVNLVSASNSDVLKI